MGFRLILFFIPLVLLGTALPEGTKFTTQSGIIQFKSDAPLEVIEAKSKMLKGVIDMEERAFAFSVDVSSFEGFNSPLQREHFNENYLETKRYKTATFIGKIIEKDDFTKDGTYSIRTKGKLTVHGITKERIIKSEVTTKDGVIKVRSNFTVLLEEHGISIPKIVYQKIAEEITVDVAADLVEMKG
ncbi:MAG: YceI family protein [Bacteroidetes bacterium]|nr:YceI family protein [Bacteroidota bacterium]